MTINTSRSCMIHEFHKGNPRVPTLIIYTRVVMSLLAYDTRVANANSRVLTLMALQKIGKDSKRIVSSKVMPIYSVLDTSIHFILLCTNTLSLSTLTEKYHFT